MWKATANRISTNKHMPHCNGDVYLPVGLTILLLPLLLIPEDNRFRLLLSFVELSFAWSLPHPHQENLLILFFFTISILFLELKKIHSKIAPMKTEARKPTNCGVTSWLYDYPKWHYTLYTLTLLLTFMTDYVQEVIPCLLKQSLELPCSIFELHIIMHLYRSDHTPCPKLDMSAVYIAADSYPSLLLHISNQEWLTNLSNTPPKA